MTQPTVVFFGPDGSSFESQDNKIYIRTLLYSTAPRGTVVESLHLSVKREETRQNFNIWVYGKRGELFRGSGLFVSREGVTLDHHFLLPKDGSVFQFLMGQYKLVVFAKLVRQKQPRPLCEIKLTVDQAQAELLKKRNCGLYFDWGPDQQRYHGHIDNRPKVKPQALIDAILDLKETDSEDS